MTDPTRFRVPLTTATFFDALVAAGVLPADQRVRRVVIDAQFGPNVVVMHVDMYGDERLLSVVPTLDGVKIERGDPLSRSDASVSEPPNDLGVSGG